jgi:hypothetical protein
MKMPTKRIKATDVTENLREQICTAEEIWLVDPKQRTGQDNKHSWMEMIVSVPPPVRRTFVDPSVQQADPATLEIEVDSTDSEGPARIREQIRKMCGQPTIEPPQAMGAV